MPFLVPVDPATGLALPILVAVGIEALRGMVSLGLDEVRRRTRVRSAVAGVWPAVRGARLAATDAVLVLVRTARDPVRTERFTVAAKCR